MTFMETNGIPILLNPNKITSEENNILNSLDGEKGYLKSPLLNTTHEENSKHKRWGKVVFSLLALLAIVACLALASNQSSKSTEWLKFKLNGYMEETQGPDSIVTSRGAVASDDSRCSEIGVNMLRLGGHAVDAAIATTVCVAVVNPTESSIGGGAFMIVREATTSKGVAFDMRETAPGAAHQNMYADNPNAQFEGPLAMAVPGELKGLYEAWKMYGRLPWATLLRPAILYARYGFHVYDYLARYAAEFEAEILADPGLRQVLAPYGRVLKRGELCFNRKLADTLDAVALFGPDVLYNGYIGRMFVHDVQAAGGILTMEDLRTYEVNVTDALEVDFLGYKLFGMHPPTSGTLGLAMVSNIFKNYESTAELEGPLGLHRLTEALKHLFAIRMDLGDPAFDDLSKVIDQMTSPAFGTEIWKRIDDNTTFPPEYYQRRWSLVEDLGTSHQSVVDAERNAVSVTASINDHFGAKFLSPSTGIVINNQMGDFSVITAVPAVPSSDNLPPAVTNLIVPGKRPLSSMCPLVIEKDGKFAGVMGATGGRNIAAAVVQTILNHFVFGKNLVDAVHTARIYPKLAIKDLDYEDFTVFTGEHIGLSEETKKFLAERNHNMTKINFPAFCHIITQNYGPCDLGRKVGEANCSTVTAVSDIRKGAKPAHE